MTTTGPLTLPPVQRELAVARSPRPTSPRSTQMYHLMHEDLARAHQQRRLQEAERQRLAAHVVRLAKARRAAQRAERAAERAQLRLRLLVS